MRIGFKGDLRDEPRVRAAFIGCGSHAFRNLYPTLQFAPVELAAVCDLKPEKAQAFAQAFGASQAYSDHRLMLAREKPEAVFLCLGYDPQGRPLYPAIAADCLAAGCHVWMEKPAAATCAEIDALQAAATQAGRHVMVGLKKMFAPANEKARALMDDPAFGPAQLALVRYPVRLPSEDEFRAYLGPRQNNGVRDFLDHLCHPMSLLLLLLGMPATLHYRRSPAGAGVATFSYASGAVASLAMTHGASNNGGMEHTVIVSDRGRHISVENNTRVTLHRQAPLGYGDEPNYYAGGPDEGSRVWEPEFSLGQLYNKSLFLLGYYNEINAFARAILDHHAPAKGTLEHAWQVTRVFEAFARGAGREIDLENLT
jgi:predicted dehydrogenase